MRVNHHREACTGSTDPSITIKHLRVNELLQASAEFTVDRSNGMFIITRINKLAWSYLFAPSLVVVSAIPSNANIVLPGQFGQTPDVFTLNGTPTVLGTASGTFSSPG